MNTPDSIQNIILCKGETIMFTPLIFKDTNFYIYRINEKCEVMKNGELLKPEDYIYHSTNGYDYILLEKFDGTLTMYPLDQVVYNSFNTNPIVDGYKCIHIDGNLRNNNLYNLERVEDIEEWRVVTYPGVPENTYEISSWGNIKRYKECVKLFPTLCNTGYYSTPDKKKILLHRMVAHEFLQYDEWNSDIIINHIDNNRLNNNVMNLEIVTTRQNTHHAMMLGVFGSNNIRTDDMIRTFCELYVKYEGDIKKVKEDLRELDLIDYFGNRFISRIIRKECWTDITDEYFKLGDYELPYKEYLNEKEIEIICNTLVQCNGSVKTAIEIIHDMGYTRITSNDVKKIRYKYQWTEISDKYFIIDKNGNFIILYNKE